MKTTNTTLATLLSAISLLATLPATAAPTPVSVDLPEAVQPWTPEHPRELEFLEGHPVFRDLGDLPASLEKANSRGEIFAILFAADPDGEGVPERKCDTCYMFSKAFADRDSAIKVDSKFRIAHIAPSRFCLLKPLDGGKKIEEFHYAKDVWGMRYENGDPNFSDPILILFNQDGQETKRVVGAAEIIDYLAKESGIKK